MGVRLWEVCWNKQTPNVYVSEGFLGQANVKVASSDMRGQNHAQVVGSEGCHSDLSARTSNRVGVVLRL